MEKLNLKKNDKVIVTKGKDRGKTGKILKSFPSANKVLVENLNIYKKHRKPRKEGEVGQVVELSRPITVSNVMLMCPHCNKQTRVGHEIIKDKKTRVCKKCHKKID